MELKLDRKDLETLVKGTSVYYSEFENELVKKAGHFYSDQYGKTTWDYLNRLTDEEIYKLYLICKNSYN